MNFALGDKLRVDGDDYEVIGIISYRNRMDNAMWMEYRIYSQQLRQERWLSYDEEYREYSISGVANRNTPTDGYHEVDRGVEEVIGAWGNVDVEIGDTANFIEYEDLTEEKIISHEIWDDGLEVSTGYYLDENEIVRTAQGGTYQGGTSCQSNGFATEGFSGGGYSTGRTMQMNASGEGTKNLIKIIACVFPIMIFLSTAVGAIGGSTTKISKYLDKSGNYTYKTSITGTDKQKADVYSTAMDVDRTAKDIIAAVDGKTEDVQQNTEDGDDSVAILTSKEYCLVYMSEDGDTLVQVSSREYAYTTDKDPYRSRVGTRRYYKRYYYSRGYSSDSGKYSSTSSPYSSYSDSTISSNPTDTYSSYAGSVRQASTTTRSSSGGGTSSGK